MKNKGAEIKETENKNEKVQAKLGPVVCWSNGFRIVRVGKEKVTRKKVRLNGFQISLG